MMFATVLGQPEPLMNVRAATTTAVDGAAVRRRRVNVLSSVLLAAPDTTAAIAQLCARVVAHLGRSYALYQSEGTKS